MTTRSSQYDPWFSLRLDSEEGLGLIRPHFEIRFAVEYPEPKTVLRFQDAVHALIGDRLNRVDTGSGRWTRRTSHTDLMIPAWCRDPVPWPKKVDTFIAQETKRGIGDVKLEIQMAARERKPPPPNW